MLCTGSLRTGDHSSTTSPAVAKISSAVEKGDRIKSAKLLPSPSTLTLAMVVHVGEVGLAHHGDGRLHHHALAHRGGAGCCGGCTAVHFSVVHRRRHICQAFIAQRCLLAGREEMVRGNAEMCGTLPRTILPMRIVLSWPTEMKLLPLGVTQMPRTNPLYAERRGQ